MFLKERLERENIFLEDDFYKCCEIFTQSLLDYTKVHNITRLRDKKSVEEAIFDSIYPVKFLPSFKRVLDIGTGAGFPGLILSFAFKKSDFFLVEPIMKRSAFLHLMKSKCDLKNVAIFNNRVEKIESFEVDLITSRAVADTETLLDLSKNFRGEETLYLFYKGEESIKQISAQVKDYKIFERGKRKYLIIKI